MTLSSGWNGKGGSGLRGKEKEMGVWLKWWDWVKILEFQVWFPWKEKLYLSKVIPKKIKCYN